MANNKLAYGLAKENGIDTTGMTPKEVWDALAEKGISVSYTQNMKYEDIVKEENEELASQSSNSSSNTYVKFIEPSAKDFHNCISRAKSIDKNNGWAVDIHSLEDYNKMRMKLTENGGAGIAVETNGNIVSVFNAKDSGHTKIATSLLSEAVAMGGDRLDAYGKGLFKIYTKNGFEPISWVEWNDEYAPPDWDESKGRHPVIFYKYTGNVTELEYDEFISNTKASVDYDTAQSIRDKEINK